MDKEKNWFDTHLATLPTLPHSYRQPDRLMSSSSSTKAGGPPQQGPSLDSPHLTQAHSVNQPLKENKIMPVRHILPALAGLVQEEIPYI